MAHDHHHHDHSSYYLEQLFTVAVCGALAAVALISFFSDVRYSTTITITKSEAVENKSGAFDPGSLDGWQQAKVLMLGSIALDGSLKEQVLAAQDVNAGAGEQVAAVVSRDCKLSLMLHRKFHFYVLLGSLLLLTTVTIRAVVLWFQVDKDDAAAGHEHDHDHAHDHHHEHGCCDHDHDHDHGVVGQPALQGVATSLPVVAGAGTGHHDHDHDHDHTHERGHDHGWAPWRYIVLMLPLMLYFLNLPNRAFQAHGSDIPLMGDMVAPEAVADRGTTRVGFTQLEEAALTEERRAYYEGKTVRLTGMYKDYDNKRFTLIRYKINCCAADAVPVKALIMVDPKATSERLDTDKLRSQWVEVTGRIAFIKEPGGERYVTALILYAPVQEKVKIVPIDANPWLQ
jgi:hypothetical protein